jgi:N6-L-threonylcarbamoyladenine synthase
MERATVVLGVETSCDETSAALLVGDQLRSHVILSQDVHKVYAGVVPELAARAHMRVLDDVVTSALDEAGLDLAAVDVFGVTAGPGLIGALLVGVAWSKSAAWALSRPLVGVHHMEAHLFAASLEDPDAVPPFVALLVSGGHTLLLWVPEWGHYELLGETRDDAAGEAFDKVARILGMEYPGGPEIERAAARAAAASADRAADEHAFPRPMLAGNQSPRDDAYYAFSFSGLKTAVLNRVQTLRDEGRFAAQREEVARSFQRAVIDVLVSKTMRAVDEKECRRVLIGGGVAASQALRSAFRDALGEHGRLFHPSPRMATDNGAMIARTAAFRYDRGDTAGLDLSARADLPFPGLVRR